jgi:peptidoglycan/xylan/chitin deacetylase (PgdA/CDA1 family)
MIVVPIEHHMLNPGGKPFKHPGAMVTPYPDLRHYTSRDYGNRVGVFRLFKALADAGLKATVPVNARQLIRLRPVVDAALAAGHEIAAHGLSTDHIHWSGLEPGVEAGWIAEARELFDIAGLAPRTWMSPARQQSFATLDLLADRGFDICLDWESDDVPIAMATAGGPVHAVPLFNELDDRTLLIDRRQTEDLWADQVIEAARFLHADGVAGRVLGFTLTPYVAGQPFRQQALRRMLAGIAAEPAVWSATASEIVTALA